MITPRNPVALHSGPWDASRHVVPFQIRLNGFPGTFLTSCVTEPFYHAQHVVRLPNKDGRAYFAVTQSNSNAGKDRSEGLLLVFKTDANVLDSSTYLLTNTPGTDAEYVFQEKFNVDSAIGDWNHPGKMGRLGDVLIVAGQNWTSDWCNARPGKDPDAAVFYDVSDPEKPRYLGKIDQNQLSTDEVAALGFFTIGDSWFLAIQNKILTTKSVSADFKNWKVLGTSSGNPIGQHGMNFNSLEQQANATDRGTERVMYFDGTSNSDGSLKMMDVKFLPSRKYTPETGTTSRLNHLN